MRFALAVLLFAAVVPAAAMPICGEGRRVTCVVDGDTFWLNREKIRLVGIDAPEVSHPRCALEARLGRAATQRLAQLLTGEIRLTRTGTDPFGRTLASVTAAGHDVGRQLVAEALARPWPGHKVEWC